MLGVAAAVAALALAGAAVSPADASPAPGSPNDPKFADQWGPQQVHAPTAWATSTGANVIIAVVDNGVDRTHEDLAGKVLSGNTFVDCGNQGCGDGSWFPNDNPDDYPAHGTHVSGIAAAITDNGKGIAGVAPDAKILPVRSLGPDGGSFEDIGLGIRWAADHGAKVINLSLGAIPGVQALELTGLETSAADAIAYARSKGAVVVLAAGNEAAPLCASPSFNDGALCVTATDMREGRSYYSNDPVKPDLLTVAAPGGSGLPICGEDILSTVPAGTANAANAETCGWGSGRNYEEAAGTSMASPHVAGVAALVVAMGCTDDETLDILTATSRQPVTGVRGVYTPAYGYGIVDAAAAVTEASTACGHGGTTTTAPTTTTTAASTTTTSRKPPKRH
jgi:serine protease